MSLDRRFAEPAAIRPQLNAIFVSLELSRKTWLVTSLSPGGGEKMSKRTVAAGDVAALLALLADLRRRALERTGTSHPIVVIREAGLDGFWLHRALEAEGCESHVVDPGSIAVPRRRRRAKSDRIDGETLLRALLAFKRGEPRVCSNGAGADAGGRGRAANLPRARRADRGAGPARQPDQGATVLARGAGL